MSLNAQELIAITASITVMLSILMSNALNSFLASPTVSAVVNATSVVFKNTEVVWRPVLLALAPLAQKAVELIKPTLKVLVKVLLFVWNLTYPMLSMIRDMGLTVSSATSAFVAQVSDLGTSLLVIGKAMSSLVLYTVKAVHTVVQSFEEVFTFISRVLFQTHTVTLNDLYNIAIPFLVVLSVVSFLMWSTRKPSPVVKTIILRRSSRLARKREMLSSGDLKSLASSCQKSSSRAANL